LSAGLVPRPLTAEAFAPFGDVIEAGRAAQPMNDASFRRYDDLARIDCDPAAGGRPAIGLVQCAVATGFPCTVRMLERHPLGSQAFVPLGDYPFLVVVAPPGDLPDVSRIAAFVSNGQQGINYRRGTWHMPLTATSVGQSFLVVDRFPGDDNCEAVDLDEPIVVDWRP